MKVIVPMAGMGKRLRPHTLTTAKPLLPIAGKPIVERLVVDICNIYEGTVNEIAFIVGDFGVEVEQTLISIAESLGAKGTIYRQEQPLGTAHAVYCAADSMDGEVVIAFADTLFHADFKLNRQYDGVIWVKSVKDPRSFGVVVINEQGIITEMIEKPEHFVSDLAIIGIYYIKEGQRLLKEIMHLIQNNIRHKGEYQLTDALASMKNKGAAFAAGQVIDWMDCGNKEAVLDTNKRVLQRLNAKEQLITPSSVCNSVVIPPCYIHPDAVVKNSVVGPNVSVGAYACVENAIVKDTILRNHCNVSQASIKDSIIGEYSKVEAVGKILNLGDYSLINL